MIALSAIALLVALPTGAAAAEAPKPLWQRCDGQLEELSCSFPRGIAVNPVNGHVLLSDQSHNRIVEYTAWGELVKAWGWGVANGSPEPQVCTTAAGCQEGLPGGGSGQLENPQGIAVDSLGNVYVFDVSNARVEKFDSAGHFVWMIGGEVDKTKDEEGGSTEAQRNLCTAASGDVCKAGAFGNGKSQFSSPETPTANLGIGSADKLYVGDTGRIQVFEPSGAFKELLPDPEGLLAGNVVKSLAIKGGALYVDFRQKENVLKLNSASGAKQCTATVKTPTALAIDGANNLYAFDETSNVDEKIKPEVREFSSACAAKGVPFGRGEISASTGLAAGSACFNTPSKETDLYVSDSLISSGFARAYGPAPNKEALCPKPAYPPRIVAQFAVSVGTVEALLRAQIDPRFREDTTYFVQYATVACIEEAEEAGEEAWEAPCVKERPAAPGVALGAGAIDLPASTAGVFIDGLQAATVYRYRFAAQSSGGGPVFGVGGKPGQDGAEGAFATLGTPTAGPRCSNEALRTGPSAQLPDCRAYEMVSPIEKEGGDITVFRTSSGHRPVSLNQGSESGDALTYSSFRAFGDAQGAPYTSQYIASRGEGGWATHDISPPQGIPVGGELAGSDREYQGFSADLCNGWLVPASSNAPPLAPGGTTGFSNLYRRSNCGAGAAAYEWIGAAESKAGGVELQGLTPDGSQAVFITGAKLTEDASSAKEAGEPIAQLYESSAGGLHLVSVLPDGEASAKPSSAGTANFFDGRSQSVDHALSADGSRVFWSQRSSGRIFLRENSTASQSALAEGGASGEGNLASGSAEVTGVVTTTGAFASGQRIAGPGIPFGTTIVAVGAGTLELSAAATKTTAGAALEASSPCTEPEKACTLPVSEPGTEGRAQFWAASADGSKAIFTPGEVVEGHVGSFDLYELDVEAEEAHLIAHEVAGVLGASEDASRIYLVSAEDLTPGKENSEGEEAEEGKPNLYLYEAGEGGGGGSFTFVTRLASADAEAATFGALASSPINVQPFKHSARVSSDGESVAFMSKASLTGYDNTDQGSGEADAEVYRYEAASAQLECVSCDPSGARPRGRDIVAEVTATQAPFWVSAQLASPESQTYASHALSDDGSRVFFESFDPLVLADTNGKKDVYEWEALGAGPEEARCSEASPSFSPANGGCLSLISSGTSPQDSDFIDASPSGRDVFIRTGASLVPQDPGLIDIYDAREGGGFPAPPAPEPPCEGEACQSPPAPPAFATPSSKVFHGPGNQPGPKRCAKGRRRVLRHGKARCLPRHHRRAHGNHRRAGR